MNFCEAYGALVGGSYELPADVSDYQWIGRRPLVGCNRLRCIQCQEWVRTELGWEVVAGAVEHLAELYEATDWRAVPWVKGGDPRERLYVCRCGAAAEAGAREIEQAVERSPAFPWRCGGHAPVTLPFVLKGVEITESTDFEELVRTSDPAHPEGHPDRTAPVGPEALRGRLAGTPWLGRLDAALVAGLGAPEPAVRMVALHYLRAHPEAGGGDRVLALAEGDRAGFAGVPDPQAVFGPTLEARLLVTLAHLVEAGTVGREALLVLRRDAVRPAFDALLLPTLLRIDRAWALDQLVAAVAAAPARAPELVLVAHGALGFEYDALKELLQRIIAQPGVSPDAIRAEADAQLGSQAATVTALLPPCR